MLFLLSLPPSGIMSRMQAHTHLGSKGITSIFQHQGDVPLISLQFWVQTGSIHESPQLGSGLSHLLEHMVFKGTRSYDTFQLADRVSSLGGMWNAYTSTDRTVYHIDGPAAHWKEFLSILHELVFHPSFPRDEWEREREVIRREMAMYDDDPHDLSYRTLIETLFRAHPRRLPVIGHPALFDALSYEDMLAYHQRRYTPQNTFVVCSCGGGVLTQQDFTAELETLQSEISAPQPSPQPSIAAEPVQWGSRLERREFAQPTSTLMLAWRIPHAGHPDAPALSILSSILGGGRAAWLHALFHDEEGLAHDVSCTLIPEREGEGAFIIEADCEREKRDELRDRLLDYLSTLAESDGFTEGIQRALAQLQIQRLRALSTVQGRANSIGVIWHLTRNLQLHDEWEQALKRVTAADIQRVITTYLHQSTRCEVSIDPLGSNPEEGASSTRSESTSLTQHELPQGLRLVTRPDPSLPIVHISLAIGAGCGSEDAATAGINSLLSECLLKGTHTRSSSDIANGLENRGSSIDSEAGNNTILITSQCLSHELSYTLDILADIILHPSLPEDAIATEKESMIADILDAEEDPLAYAFRSLRPLCYGESSYGLIPDGTVESVSSLTREQLLAQHARLFCGRNMVLSLTGELPDDLVDQVSRLLDTLPAGCAVTRSSTAPQQAADARMLLDKEQSVITLALPSPPVNSEENTTMSLILEWFRDAAGPLFTELREKRGLAYYATAAAMSGVDTGCFYFYLGTSPEQETEAREALTACLTDLYEQGIPAEIFERTRALALVGHQIQMQSQSRIGKNLAIDTLLGLPSDQVLTLPERFASITHAEVEDNLRELLHPEATRTWVTVSKC